MTESVTKRLAALALLLLLPGLGLLTWWAWQGLEDDLVAETQRIRRFEELAAFQVVNNLGSELFHLQYTFSLGVLQASGSRQHDWPRAIESMVATYRMQAHYPQILSDLILVSDTPGQGRRWVRWSAEGWIESQRPQWIPASMTLFDPSIDPTLDLGTPIMVFSLPPRKTTRQALVVRYSTDEVLNRVVPDLIDQAFSDGSATMGYRVAVVRKDLGSLANNGGSADLVVPLVPRVRFSEWLRNYLDRIFEPPRYPWETYQEGVGWALKVKLLPAGLAAHTNQIRAANARWLGVLGLLLAVGLGLILWSLRRLVQAASRERAFSSLVSHELKTPLAAIQSLAENLADGVVADPARVRDYGAALRDQSGRLNEMVMNVLTLAVLETNGRMILEDFDLCDLAWSVAARSDLSVGAGPGPWIVRGNRTALRAALDNLVTNAFRHGTRDGEEAMVAMGMVRRQSLGRRWIGVAVTDHGPGLSRAERRTLFDPYRRGSRAGSRQTPGGGVGLSLVRLTLRHLGGSVQARPVPGGGLTLTLWLKEGAKR